MPFNPVYNLKAANIWLQQGLDESIARSRSRSSDSTLAPGDVAPLMRQNSNKSSTSLFCGYSACDYLHFKASQQLGYVHVAFWAVFLYLLGSIVYLIDSALLWPLLNPSYSDDYQNPAIYLNTVGAAIFVLDAIICFMDWHLQIRQIKQAEKFAKGELLSAIAGISYSTSWLYFYNNVFFLAAAMIFMIQAIWYRAIAEDLLRCERIM